MFIEQDLRGRPSFEGATEDDEDDGIWAGSVIYPRATEGVFSAACLLNAVLCFDS